MKVAIVGAGICGLYLAQKFSLAGHKVTIFEKRNKIGKEACSGLFSERILNFFPQSRNLIENEINFVLVHFPKKNLKIKFAKKFLVIDHSKLDKLAAGLAESAGTEIILEREILDLPQGFDKVIGCDGAASVVRRKLRIKDPKIFLAFQAFENKSDSSNIVEVWPVGNGFIWKIPRGNKLEYGGIGEPKEIKENFDKFLTKNNLQLEDFRAAAVPRGFSFGGNESISLCGDAAGLTKPWSGGGVVWGLSAADILLKNFPDLLKYHRAAKISFYPRIILGTLATRFVYFFGYKFPWVFPDNIKFDGDFLKI